MGYLWEVIDRSWVETWRIVFYSTFLLFLAALITNGLALLFFWWAREREEVRKEIGKSWIVFAATLAAFPVIFCIHLIFIVPAEIDAERKRNIAEARANWRSALAHLETERAKTKQLSRDLEKITEDRFALQRKNEDLRDELRNMGAVLAQSRDNFTQLRLDNLEKKDAPTFSKEMPNGYSLFSVTRDGRIIPYQSDTSRPIRIFWESLAATIKGRHIEVRMPTIFFGKGSRMLNDVYDFPIGLGNGVSIAFDPDSVGDISEANYVQTPGTIDPPMGRYGNNPTIRYSLKIVAVERGVITFLIGLSPYIPTWPLSR